LASNVTAPLLLRFRLKTLAGVPVGGDLQLLEGAPSMGPVVEVAVGNPTVDIHHQVSLCHLGVA
jgi:hypothetical protein